MRVMTGNELKELKAQYEALESCGDGNCIVRRNLGMHTNGGCRCVKSPIASKRGYLALVHYGKLVPALFEEIDQLRAENEKLRSRIWDLETHGCHPDIMQDP